MMIRNMYYDVQVRRFPLAQPLLLIAIDSKVRQLFPAIAEEEVMIVIVIIIFIANVIDILVIFYMIMSCHQTCENSSEKGSKLIRQHK